MLPAPRLSILYLSHFNPFTKLTQLPFAKSRGRAEPRVIVTRKSIIHRTIRRKQEISCKLRKYQEDSSSIHCSFSKIDDTVGLETLWPMLDCIAAFAPVRFWSPDGFKQSLSWISRDRRIDWDRRFISWSMLSYNLVITVAIWRSLTSTNQDIVYLFS